ncbi:RhoGAP domain-containing protein [Colletotrichum graminicola]|nr:RhoGAP domain-containing protein [Colletotrichum graminicola]
MQPYNNNEPSLPSDMSRDPEAGTLTSQATSTAPTSTVPPRLPIAASMASINASDVGRRPLTASNTLPGLTIKEGHRGRLLPSSATWASSIRDLAMFSDTDDVQDRLRFVQEYNRLAKKV